MRVTGKLEVLGLLQQELDLGEVLREDWAAGAHEVEDVAEHASISERERGVFFAHFKNFKVKGEPVDEVMLLESVKDDGDPSAEQTRQSRLRESGDGEDVRFMSIV